MVDILQFNETKQKGHLKFLLRRRLIVRPDLKQISVGLSLALSLVSGAVAAVTALPRALMTKVEVGNGTEEEEEDVMSMCFEVSSNSKNHVNDKSCALCLCFGFCFPDPRTH